MSMHRRSSPAWLGCALSVLLPILAWSEAAGQVTGNSLHPEQVAEALKRAAEWQLDHPSEKDPRHWSMAMLYDGLIDMSLATGDPRYLAAVVRAGERVNYILGSRTYHADGHGAGHAWLRIYLMDPQRDPELIEPFVEQFNEIVEHPILQNLTFTEDPPPGLRRTDRWSWADALYMSPPTIAILAQATGDKRYTRFMDAEVRVTYDALFDKEAHLFYRDASYIGQETPSGEQVFWSRGNGWVYAGLALVLDHLPADYPTRCFYTQLFHQMSEALAKAQQPDGFWYPSLLDAQQVPIGETSGTALFVLGMAWGVRNGLLDSATYWPIVERGWNAILSIMDPDGAINFVQPFGEAPQPFDPTSRVSYGTGAVLGAGAQILQALGAAPQVDPAQFLAQAVALIDEVPDLSQNCERCEL